MYIILSLHNCVSGEVWQHLEVEMEKAKHFILDQYLQTLPPVAADYIDCSTTYLLLWIYKKAMTSFICNPYMAHICLLILFVILYNNKRQLLC